MKKKRGIGSVISVLVLLATITVSFILCSCGTKSANIQYEPIELHSIFEEIHINSARGEEKYEGGYYQFSGIVSYISNDSSFSVVSIKEDRVNCKVKNKNVKNAIIELDKNDYIKVYGKIVSVSYDSIGVEVDKIEKIEPFSYDGIEFGLDIDEVRKKETKKSVANGAMVGDNIPYTFDDSYIDEFGYNPDFIRYGFHGWTLSKISLSYTEVDLAFFNTVVNRFTEKYGEPANTKEDSKYIKRFLTDSVLATIYYYEDSSSAGIIYMYPAYYSLSNYLTE